MMMLRAHTQSLRPLFGYWLRARRFDRFVNNQNVAADLPQDCWTTTFRAQIESIGKVILVLSPWSDPVPLTRAWCLYEILCSLDGDGVDFMVRLPPSEVASFNQGLLLESFESAMSALVSPQAENARAFNQSDKDMIFQAVEQTIGFPRLNELVKDQTRQWFLETGLELVAEHELQGSAASEIFADLCHNLASMMHEFGENDKALEHYNKSLYIKLETVNWRGQHINRGDIQQHGCCL